MLGPPNLIIHLEIIAAKLGPPIQHQSMLIRLYVEALLGNESLAGQVRGHA